jgi:membrane protease YdiL (CAAX protease family)
VASYTAFTFVQELVARGGIQTALERFLPGPRPERRALLLATVLFSATHFHVAPGFALATLVPGLFWGWLYQRHRTLAGVTLNHALVGLYAIFVLGRSVLG